MEPWARSVSVASNRSRGPWKVGCEPWWALTGARGSWWVLARRARPRLVVRHSEGRGACLSSATLTSAATRRTAELIICIRRGLPSGVSTPTLCGSPLTTAHCYTQCRPTRREMIATPTRGGAGRRAGLVRRLTARRVPLVTAWHFNFHIVTNVRATIIEIK